MTTRFNSCTDATRGQTEQRNIPLPVENRLQTQNQTLQPQQQEIPPPSSSPEQQVMEVEETQQVNNPPVALDPIPVPVRETGAARRARERVIEEPLMDPQPVNLAREANRAGLNLNQALRHTAHQPEMDRSFPNTWQRLVAVWEEKRFNRFLNADQRLWNQSLRSCYRKWSNAMTELCRFRGLINESPMESAIRLERVRVFWVLHFLST